MNRLILLFSKKNYLKGPQWSELVKSSYTVGCPGFLVAQEQKLGTTGHQALPKRSLACYFVLVVSAIMHQFLLATGASYLFLCLLFR